MTLFMPKLTCPFCFQIFALQDIRFRCMRPACTGKAPDALYAHARNYGEIRMGRVLIPRKHRFSMPKMVECDICKEESSTRVCPYCHFELPHDIGQTDQRIIAIVGGRDVGKTHYIASLITRLKYSVGSNFHFTVQMLDENTNERWERDFHTPLFVQRTVLQPTRPADIDAQVKAPLIFRLTWSHANVGRALNICFFDSAGEDMTSFTTMSTHNRYICRADGIIFLLDPLQIPSIRQQLTSVQLPTVDPQGSPEHIVVLLRKLFETQQNLRATRPTKVPIAFTLSKVDTLFPLLDPGSALHRPSEHSEYLDLDDIQGVSTEIDNYLRSWINVNFCNFVNASFATHHYFGVSSLGREPDAQKRLLTVSPLRVEDPFLWILYKLGLIKGRRG
jgi:Double-GTPase 2